MIGVVGHVIRTHGAEEGDVDGGRQEVMETPYETVGPESEK